MKTMIGNYINGNYRVIIFNDGTKIRYNNEDKLTPEFAESCDVCITKYCDNNCPYCYEGCSINGKHANLDQPWINSLHPYTELALNGNDLSHPDLINFLKELKSKKIISNLTVNQTHFEKKIDFINNLIADNLIYGLGVSLNNPTDNFISLIKDKPNTVIHTINGILTKEQIYKLEGLKVLILGYKDLGRGIDYKNKNNKAILKNQTFLYNNLELLNKFNIVSFDNLALEQLNIRRLLSNKEWESFFMGRDSEYTFYIDMVNKKFAKNSISQERFNILDNIDDMFNKINKGV